MRRQTSSDISPADFIPTGKQQALLDVLLDPYHRMASVIRVCEIAGVSRNFYYECLKDPGYVAYYDKECNYLLRGKRGQLLNLAIREARKGGTAGFGYWKELAKMEGLIQDDKVQHEHSGEITVRFADPDDEDEDL